MKDVVEIGARTGDGSEVPVRVEGTKTPEIVVLPPGLDDCSGWQKPSKILSGLHRVTRVWRRPYWKVGQENPCSIAQEVDDTLAILDRIGTPVVLVGHSSGGVVALECALKQPDSVLALVIYEAPVSVGSPLGGEAVAAAREALDKGQRGKAIAIFLRDVVEVPGAVAWIVRLSSPLIPQVRKYAAGQICELEAIRALGDRIDGYRGIRLPVLLIGGSKSPAHLARRLDALESVLPTSKRIELDRVGHDANLKKPKELAREIEEFVAGLPLAN